MLRYLLLVVLCVFLNCVAIFAAEIIFSPQEQKILARADELSDAFTIIAEKVRPAIVNIQVERSDGRISQGSGVILDERGYVLTNNHVVQSANTIIVRLTDGREIISELVGQSPESDLAVIRIPATNLTVAMVGNSDACKVGSWILAIGNPLGLESSVAAGIISAKGRSNVVRLEIADFIQTDAAINPGSSGGALVNLRGEVIGINAVTSRNTDGLGFAIPINLATTIMKGIINNRQATSSYLGVAFRAVDQQISQAFGLSAIRGALIEKVIANTPAARANLQVGDIILRYGDREIFDEHQLRTFIATTAPDALVNIEYWRQGKKNNASVKIEALPEEIIVSRRVGKLLDDLGVQVIDLTPQRKKDLGYEESARGVLVVQVARGSNAQSFLSPGSLIIKIDQQEIDNLEQLHNAILKAANHGEVTIGWRFGKYYGSRKLVRE